MGTFLVLPVMLTVVLLLFEKGRNERVAAGACLAVLLAVGSTAIIFTPGLRACRQSENAALPSGVTTLKGGVRLEFGAMLVAFASRIDRPLVLSSLQIGRVHLLHLPGEGLIDFQLFAHFTNAHS